MADPRREAEAVLGGRFSARVLEPSPPAVVDGDYFADDPAVLGSDDGDGRPVVSPTGDGDVRWVDLTAAHTELTAWAAARWLGPWPRLEPLTEPFAATRGALHRLGVFVLAPARRAVTGKIGLRFTRDGFGTPFFGPDRQVRVAGDKLVLQEGAVEQQSVITTLAAAARAVGVELSDAPGVGSDIPPMGDRDTPLDVARDASLALGAVCGFAASVLEEFRWDLRRAGDEAERVQLWPEHFDMAMHDGWANYGMSPGDAHIPQPYLYVGPWDHTERDDRFWNAPFGAVLHYDELLAAPDQRAAALAFLHRGRQRRPE